MATPHEPKQPKAPSAPADSAERDTPSRREAGRDLARRDPWGTWTDSFDAMRRFIDRLDRPFGALWHDPTGFLGRRTGSPTWAPQIETFQRGDQFIVRADLPGLTKDDISVEVQDNALVIEGERKQEREEEQEGYYLSERSYGRFARVVKLPEGAVPDSVKATFKNGVLEVVVLVPPRDTSRGRKIEITEGRTT